MKTNFVSLVCFVISASLLLSCNNRVSQEESLEIIPVDIKKAKPIDLRLGKMIELETTDSSLLYDISNITFWKEKFFILSRDKIVVFDNKGHFLYNLSRKGQGPGEYTMIKSVFVLGTHICIYDAMEKKLLCFDHNGTFISSQTISSDPYQLSDIYPLDDGTFIAKNMFRGEQVVTPFGAHLDDQYAFIKTISGKNITSGSKLGGPQFFQYENHVLYIEIFSDTIYAIQNYEHISPRYFVDFGKNAVPASEKDEIEKIVRYLNQPENIDKAMLLQYVSETDRYINFVFPCHTKTHFVRYDKKHKTTQIFRFEDKSDEYRPQLFFCYRDKQVYLSILSNNDSEKNPCLIVFEEEVFKF